MDMWKITEEGDQSAEWGEFAGSGGVDEWGMLMADSPSRLDLASDMLPPGLSDKPSMRSFGE